MSSDGSATAVAPNAAACWRALAAVPSVGLFATDARGRVVDTSGAWEQLFPGGAGPATGDHWWRLLHADDVATVRSAWAGALDEGRPFDVQARVVRADGTARHLRLRAAPAGDRNGAPCGIAGWVEDVTAQRRAQFDAERLLAAVRAHFIVSVTDTDSRIVEVNDAFCAISGWSRQDAIGRHHRLVNSGRHAPGFFSEMYATLRRTGSWRGEKCNRARDGRLYWLDNVLVALADADGRVDRYVSFSIDITERKRSVLALARSEELLNRTGEIAGIGGWRMDLRRGRTLTWTAQTCRIHGVPAGYRPRLEEALRFFDPHAQPRVRAAIDAAIADGTGWDLEAPLLRADGQAVVVRFVGSAERETGVDAGPVVRLFGALQDVTALVAQREALSDAHARIALAAEAGGIGIWDRDLRAGRLSWDDRMHALFGTAPGAGAGDAEHLWRAGLHPQDRERVLATSSAAQRGQSPLALSFRIVRPDGEVRHLQGAGRLLRGAQGEPVRLVGVNWDVTPLRRLSAELAEQHELLRITLRSIGDAVVTTDARGGIAWLNPAAERLTGWPADKAAGRPLGEVFRLLHEDTRTPAEDPMRRCLADGESVSVGAGIVLVARDGREHGVEESVAPIRDEQGQVRGAVLVFRDVTEQRRLTGEMRWRAAHDPLTGLVNRAEFEIRLRRVLAQAQADGSEHALMVLDLDQFKLVNDACGHSAGDLLLQQVARLFADAVRVRDTLARLGGDEFAVILERCSIVQARRVAQDICQRMEDFRFVHDGRRFRVGSSIGLVPVDRRWTTPEAVLKAADSACYAAKDAGRNRVHAWVESDVAMRLRQGDMQWATRLEQALDEGRFVLHAQRIRALAPGASAPLHAELLLRMVEPDGRLVGPSAFMPAAERYNLASRVDRWVLERALRGLARVQADAPSVLGGLDLLTVNLSGQSIGDRAFHRWALERLDVSGPGVCRRLGLEITETAAVTNLADAADFVRQVRARGVRVALDDFGAGASSFGYLKSLPVDLLKIDGQFIKDLIDDPLDAAAVRGFVDVARVMGVPTVAEFVDRPQVLEHVRRLGIQYAQGFVVHAPEAVEQVLATAW